MRCTQVHLYRVGTSRILTLVTFAIAQIQEDQLQSYADRKGWDRIEAEKMVRSEH